MMATDSVDTYFTDAKMLRMSLQHLELRHIRNHYLQQSHQLLPFFSYLLLFSYETLTFLVFKNMHIERFDSSCEWKVLLAQ